jgi:hypothetical protein
VSSSTGSETFDPARLDEWLPDPAVRVHHRREARVDRETLWRAAESVKLDDTGNLGRLVRWRIPDLPRDLTFRDMFRDYPFTVLEEGDGYSVSGMAGKIWTLRRDYPKLDGPGDFSDWDESSTVRVLFAHWIEPAGDGCWRLLSESRVKPVDKVGSLRLKGLWALVGVFERLIGAEPLAVAARRAEGRDR